MKKASDSTEDLSELFSFYKETVKPLYAVIQVDGSLPSEVLFEINAALDHVSRVFTGDQGADRAIDCARGHLKRSCLDIFKLAVKSAHDQYDELNHDKGLAYLDNGDFQSKMRQSWEEIKSAGIEARKCEITDGYSDTEKAPSFEKWQHVFALCEDFRLTYYNHSSREWADKQAIWYEWKALLLGGLIGACIGAPLGYIFNYLMSMMMG